MTKLASVSWQGKIERAEFLASQEHSAENLLRFYAKILQFQQDVQARLAGPDINQLVPFVPELLDLLARFGTAEMKELSASAKPLAWSTELQAHWNDRGSREYSALAFLTLTLLQPYAHHMAAHAAIDHHRLTPQCPFCLCPPQLGVLRPEGDGGKRSLLCSLCGTEWEYRRVICPNCEESDKEKLPVYKSDQLRRIKLAACDTCHTYLKCIDLSIDGRAIPEVDDIASLPMSLWMTENGFQPIKPNLFGF